MGDPGTDWVGIGGLISGVYAATVASVLGLLRWRDDHVRISASAGYFYPELSFAPGEVHHFDGPKFVRVIVVNSGRRPATISEVGFLMKRTTGDGPLKLPVSHSVRAVTIEGPAEISIKAEDLGTLNYDTFSPGPGRFAVGIYVTEVGRKDDHIFPLGTITEELRTDPMTIGLPPDMDHN